MSSKLISQFALVVLAAALSGCGGDGGPPRHAARGTVKLDGTPLAAGVIRFIPDLKTGGPAATATIQEGKFSMDADTGPVAGDHRVEIESTGYEGFAVDDEQAYAERAQKTPRQVIPRNPVPEIYNQRSTLTKTVTPEGPNMFDFDLASGNTTAAR